MSVEPINRATAGKDYQSVSGTLTFSKGQSVCTFKVNMIDDDIAEEDENFLIVLSNSTNASNIIVESRSVATVTMLDDADAGIISFAKFETVRTQSCPDNWIDLDEYSVDSRLHYLDYLVVSWCRLVLFDLFSLSMFG